MLILRAVHMALGLSYDQITLARTAEKKPILVTDRLNWQCLFLILLAWILSELPPTFSIRLGSKASTLMFRTR